MQINHRDRELAIGIPCDCDDDYPKLKIAGYYAQYNKIAVAAYRGGADRFFLASRGPKSDISDAQLLSGRYIVIGDRNLSQSSIFSSSITHPADNWRWLIGDETLLEVRLLIAGAVKVVVSDDITGPITRTPEFARAKAYGRLFTVCV